MSSYSVMASMEVIKQCEQCGQKYIFRHHYSPDKSHFCSRGCCVRYNWDNSRMTSRSDSGAEYRTRQSERMKNNKYGLGHKYTAEHLKKISGENSVHWRNGSRCKPYSIDWTETLKRSIRERDHYACQVCGKDQGDKALCVHHIDYDKQNCDPKNLVTLCGGCHSRTNHNRDEWIKYFYER